MKQLMGLPILTEGAVDRYIEKLIMNNMDDRMRPYFNMTLNEIYQQNPNIINQATMTQADLNQVLEKYGNTRLKDYIRLSICQLFDIRHGKGPVKYMKSIFRIVIEELKCLRNPDMQAINHLKDTVMYIQAASQEGDQDTLQVDSNLNGWSFDQVTNVFKEKRKAFFKALRSKFASFNGGKSHYTKVVINSHEDARQFKVPPKEIFQYVYNFFNGYAEVKLNGKYNFLTQEDKILSSQWFDNVDDFSEGYAEVKLNGKILYLDKEGNYYNIDGVPMTFNYQ